jgi:hypothetical protein
LRACTVSHRVNLVNLRVAVENRKIGFVQGNSVGGETHREEDFGISEGVPDVGVGVGVGLLLTGVDERLVLAGGLPAGEEAGGLLAGGRLEGGVLVLPLPFSKIPF